MNNKLQLPAISSASWIWNSNPAGDPEEFVLFRREFSCESIGGDASLFIASPCCCRIFINGCSVGFGPSVHPEPGMVYADDLDISDFIECGNNTICILAWHDPENTSTPGIWCELNICSPDRNRAAIRIGTDEEWDSAPGSLWPGLAPHLEFRKTAGFRHYTGTIPSDWMIPGRAGDARCWKNPDIIIPVSKYPLAIERSQITPPVTGSEEMFLTPVSRGKITSSPAYTRVEIPVGNRAAIGYIYSENGGSEKCTIRCRNAFKIYINGNGKPIDTNECMLDLVPGWNELQVFCKPAGRRQDLEIEFADPERKKSSVYAAASTDSTPGWSITRELKIPFEFSGWLLRSSTLIDGIFRTAKSRYTDDGSLLRNSIFTENDSVNPTSLDGGDCVIYELDEIRYGFLHLKFSAPEDTVINILAGSRRSENGLVESGITTGADIRIAGSFGNLQEYRMPLPCECRYVAVKVSALAKHKVNIHSVSFWELARRDFSDPGFSCSDEFFNLMWKKGCNMLRRCTAMVSIRSARPRVNSFLFDAYMQSSNIACLTGGSTYLTNRLNQCLAAQLENGAIPALLSGKRSGYQLPHLLFLPAWINEAYRYTADRKQLIKWVEKLDLVREFYESLIDTDYYLLKTPENWDRSIGRISSLDFSQSDRYYTCLSALFCRFMHNAAETYAYAGLEEYSQHCKQMAEAVTEALHNYCYIPEKHLFTTTAAEEGEEDPDCDACSNFSALYSGAMLPEDYEFVLNHFLNPDPPYDKTGQINSAYFHVLLTNSLFAVGLREFACEYTHDRWKKCLEHGDDAATADGTRIIPPNLFLQKNILGVRMGESGQSTVFFKPAYDIVKKASGMMPLPCGNLRIEWELHDDGHLSVLLDANVPLKIVPELSMERLSNTEFQLSEHITLLKPPKNTQAY